MKCKIFSILLKHVSDPLSVLLQFAWLYLKVLSSFLTYLNFSQQTFQRRFNVAFRLIWSRDVAQRQINVETTLCTSTLKFTTFNNVETTLRISALNWTMLDNVETTLSFSMSIFTVLGDVETMLRIWPLEKKIRLDSKTK